MLILVYTFLLTTFSQYTNPLLFYNREFKKTHFYNLQNVQVNKSFIQILFPLYIETFQKRKEVFNTLSMSLQMKQIWTIFQSPNFSHICKTKIKIQT